MKAVHAAALLAAGLTFFAVSCSKSAASPQKPTVVVSILPQKYFVDRISGGRFDVTVLVGTGQSPHSYEPTPRQMDGLSRAAAWFSIKVDFEKGLRPKVAALYPNLPIVDTSAGVVYRMLEAHSHGEAAGTELKEAEEETGPDEHIWLGKEPVKIIAAHIRDELSRLDPAGKPIYEANCAAFITDIDEAFTRLAPALLSLKGKTVFVYHPAFGYFLDEFGIRMETVEINGKEPTPRSLSALIDEAKKDGAKVIFVQAQFSQEAAQKIAAAIGGAVIPIDPLAPDWLANLSALGEAMQKAAK